MAYKRPSISVVNQRLRASREVINQITGIWISTEKELIFLELWYNKFHHKLPVEVELVYLRAVEMFIDSLDIIESRGFQKVLESRVMAEMA